MKSELIRLTAAVLSLLLRSVDNYVPIVGDDTCCIGLDYQANGTLTYNSPFKYTYYPVQRAWGWKFYFNTEKK
jgi:hypothetical protein